nr:hypothetical protein CFP56_23983 [Quercus suber]
MDELPPLPSHEQLLRRHTDRNSAGSPAMTFDNPSANDRAKVVVTFRDRSHVLDRFGSPNIDHILGFGNVRAHTRKRDGRDCGQSRNSWLCPWGHYYAHSKTYLETYIDVAESRNVPDSCHLNLGITCGYIFIKRKGHTGPRTDWTQESHLSSQQARNYRFTVSNLVLAEFLDVPFPTLQRSWQHSRDLIEQEGPRRHAMQAPHHPETGPLHPLAEVVRVKHVVEQPILRQHVEFVHAGDRLAVFLRRRLLPLERRASDLAKIIVVEDVAEEGPAHDDQPDFDLIQAARPVPHRGGTVPAEPAAKRQAIADLPAEGGNENERVDGRHGGVEDEWREDGAVDVMRTVAECHRPIGPWKTSFARFIEVRGKVWDGKHAIEDGEHAGDLHEKPCPLAGDVETRINGRFSLRIEVGDPLDGGELFVAVR